MALPPPSARRSTPQKTTGTTLRKKTKKNSDGLARRLADPGLRSKLPDSQLPADLLAKRKRNQFLAQPAAPGSSYTERDIASALKMLTSQKFAPIEAAQTRAQNAINLRRNTEIPQWFQAYRDTVAAARAANQAATAAQVQSLQGLTTQAQGATGLPAGADPEAVARANAAAQIRGAGVANQAALAQNMGGNQDAYLGNVGLLSFDKQAAALQSLFGRQSELDDERRQTASDKGSFQVSQRQEILSDEAENALKAALTESQIGENKAQTSATKATTQKTKTQTVKSKKDQEYFDKHGYYPSTGKPTSPETSSQAAVAAKNGYTLAEWRKLSGEERRQIVKSGSGKSGDKDDYGNTPKQRQAAQDSFDKAQRLARQYKTAVRSESELVDFLVGVKNINIQVARAAAQAVFHDGRVGPKTSARLKERGVTKFPKSKPKPKPAAPVKVTGPLAETAGPLAPIKPNQ